jgi:hypothetical protein
MTSHYSKRDEKAGGHVAPLLYHFVVVPDAVLIYPREFSSGTLDGDGYGDGHDGDDSGSGRVIGGGNGHGMGMYDENE